jgi:hypothetical protein
MCIIGVKHTDHAYNIDKRIQRQTTCVCGQLVPKRRSGQKPNRRQFYLAFAMFELDLLEPVSVAMITIVVMALTMVAVIMMILSMVEIEHVIEIADRRHIHRDPRVLPVHDRVR